MKSRTLMFVTAVTLFAALAAAAQEQKLTSLKSDASARHRFGVKQQAQYGVGARSEMSDKNGTAEDPNAAEEQAYENRAYPAAYIPQQLTLNAQKAWAKIKARGVGQGKSTPGNWTLAGPSTASTPGTWTLAGPSTASFPAILTFSGAAYTPSGRITALAIAPNCSTNGCRLWVAAAGGGIWRTDNALSGGGPTWTFVSDSFATNAIGTLTYDSATTTLYAGTGEPNASGDSEAGFGIYMSTDGGSTWTHLAANTSVPSGKVNCDAVFGTRPGTFGKRTAPAYTGPAFNGRSISSIVVDGSTLYVGSTRGIRGESSVTGGTVTLAPGLPPYGLWKSTDGGANFTLLRGDGICLNSLLAGDAGKIQSTFGSARGVNHIEFDPNYATNATLYAAAFPGFSGNGGGVWRSTDDGATFKRIKTALEDRKSTR